MSVFRPRPIACPHCDHETSRDVALSVNGARAPAVRLAILEDSFQRFGCEACGRRFAVDGPMSYIDFDRYQFFGVYPRPWARAWQALEREITTSFRQSLVDFAPPEVRVAAGEFRVRAVFGLDGLRDKLVSFDAGIDDTALEALKLDFLRSEPRLLLHPASRITLRRASAEELSFDARALDTEGELGPMELVVPRERLEVLADDPQWAALRARLGAGAFIDMQRFFLEGDAPRPGAEDPEEPGPGAGSGT